MKILNFGSLNLDHDYDVDHMVKEGETLSSYKLVTLPGGKGMNQSIAVQRAGRQVYHAGQIGHDELMLKELLEKNGVRTEYLYVTDVPTGHAIIQIDREGRNCILLFGGANTSITIETIADVISNFEQDDVLICQNEISHMDGLIDMAYAKGMKIALNPSPFNEKITKDMLEKCTWLFVNETEAESIVGAYAEDTDQLLNALCMAYPNVHMIVTLGGDGVISGMNEKRWKQPAKKVSVVDTTAAGDTFTGYYLSAVLEGMDEQDALHLATSASALAVTRYGAVPSIPFRSEVDLPSGI